MAQNYTRQSSFNDGDTITASLFNDEYNQLVNSFTYSSTSASSTGHRHDGSAGQGGNIFKIGDLDFLNKIEVDSTNNRWGFYVEVSSAAVEQIRIQDGAVVPVTDNDIDLGTTSLEFKDLFIDGTAHIDTLDVDENATVAGTLGVTGTTTLTGNVTTTNDLSVGGNLTVTGTTTFNGGTITMGDAATDNVVFGADVDSNIIPDDDDTYDLGSSSQEWRNLYIDGTANIDSLVADTADINGGTIDGATIATSDVTVGSGKTLDVSAGTLTLADNQISGDKVEGGTIAATTITSLASTTVDTTNLEVTNIKAKDGASAGSIADTTGVVTLASSVLTTTDINGGTIDGTVIGGTTPASITGTAITGTSFVIGSANISESELETIDGITAGTVAASKAVVVDANKDATGFRNITITGELDAATLDVSGNIDVDGVTNLDVVDIDGAVDMASTLTVASNITVGGTVDGRDVAADGTKLDGIEASADVTDTTNVTAAGALMDSELTNLTAVKALNQGVATTDSPTFAGATLTTADINSGTIDGTVIGGSTAAAGTFTTFTSTGIDDNATSTAITIDGSQNVGITGQTSPTFNLDGGFVTQTWGWHLNTSYQGGFTYTTTDRSLSIFTKSADNADYIKFSTGGSATERMRIDASGNVGIGESNPQHNLHIKGSGDTGIQLTKDGVIAGRVSAVTTGLSFGVDGANGTTERARIDSSGRVLINTTTATELLNIANTAGNGAGVEFAGNGNTIGSTSAFYGQGSGSDAYVWNRANSPVLFGTNNTERMRIDSSGNVGIGQAPDSGWGSNWKNLQVTSLSAHFASTSSSTFSGLTHGGYYDGAQWRYNATDVGATLIQSRGDTSPSMQFYVANSGTADSVITWTEAMRIDSSGNLLVGRQTTSGLGVANFEGGIDVTSGPIYARGSGIYIGGTASANLLDDYEEGTFSGTAQGSIYSGTYTKVGRICHISLDVDNANSTGTQIASLPFTSKNGGTAFNGSQPTFNTSNSNSDVYVAPYNGGSAVFIYTRTGTTQNVSTGTIIVNFVYETDA